MEFVSLTPSIIIEESLLNGDLLCQVEVDSEASFSLESSTMEYFSIDSVNGNVYLSGIGLEAINLDFPTEPYKEVQSLEFTYVATQLQTGLSIRQNVNLAVVRIHDSEPVITNTFLEPTYTDNLTDGMRLFEIRTAYPATYNIFGAHIDNFQFIDINSGRLTLTAVGNTYLQTLDWSGDSYEKIGEYDIQKVIIQISIQDQENGKAIQEDLELIVYHGNKNNLLPTKNMNELMGESLGDSIGRLAGRLDITDKEFQLEINNLKSKTTGIISKTFNNKVLVDKINRDLDNLIKRLKESEDYRDKRFSALIESFGSDFVSIIFENIKTFSNFNNNVLEIMETVKVHENNLHDSTSAKALAYGAMEFAEYYSDYNKVWGQHYTDRKINLTLADIDYKFAEAHDKINSSILSTYGSYFQEITSEMNINTGIILENYNAIKKLDYRSSETERHVGDQEARMRVMEAYDLRDWDVPGDKWKFETSTLDFNNLWKIMVNASDDIIIKGASNVYLKADEKELSWNGTTLNLGASGTNVISQTFTGRATSANYADLAEMYRSDYDYPVGTLLSIETDRYSDHEVCLYDKSKPYAGVVSENPGYLLNAGTDEDRTGECWVKLALTGRVKVLCSHNETADVGQTIKKGVYLYADECFPGKAFCTTTKIDGELIGITIANSDEDLVMAKVG